MRFLTIVSGAMLMGLPAAAAGQPKDCASITDPGSRLACYDKSRESATQTGGHGGVEGTITWQYNDFVGTKGDTGAQVVLIRQPMTESLSGVEDYHLSSIGSGLAFSFKDRIYVAEADGYGHYSLSDIPIGEYLAVIVSDNTRMFDEDVYMRDCKVRLAPHVKTLRFFYKAHCRQITVSAGKTLRLSHDFGNTGY